MGMGSLYFCSYILIYPSVCLFFFITGTYSVGGNETDLQALLKFKAGIDADPLGVTGSWNNSIHFCQWYGVTCGRRHQRVTKLNLSSSKLVGTISPYIGNLSFLMVLQLKNNSFNHNIPPEIGRLRRLQILALYNNSFTGEIPSNISRCSNLFYFGLENNKLIGKVPVNVGSLSKLKFLGLHKNNLIGTLPQSLGNLSSLVAVSAFSNHFSGNIPDALGRLKNLTFLGLAVNNFSGIIPSSIFNLSYITIFDVSYNNLKGFLMPDLFTTLPYLQAFSFSYNHIFGSIPQSLSNASNLVALQLVGNSLKGKIPSLERLNIQDFLIYENELGNGEIDDLTFLCSLTNSSILHLLDIGKNNFGGSLPECIGNLSSSVGSIGLWANQISGSIPNSIGKLVNLDTIALQNNKFSGMIPESVGNLRNLVVMSFEQNKLFGPIPSSFGNLTKLNRVYLSNNNLQGTIPSTLGNCTNLQYLDLSRNNLTGILPSEVIGLSSLSIYVNLSQNHFNGSLPNEVGNLKALGTLDISYNMLSGEITKSLASCISLEYLYMNHNHFEGSIPFSLSSLKGLQIVDFSQNNLSGKIPEFFARFRLLFILNLSYNDFEGTMPTDGIFRNATITLIMGNNKLCGGIFDFHLPVCDLKRSSKMRLKVIIAPIVGILGAILVMSSLFLLRKKAHNPNSSNSENSLLNLPRVSYGDLHKATGGFLSTNLIGSGGFGSVYKGVLNEWPQMVAIKVLNLQYRGATKSFIAECDALKNIRHRNLVKIVTACSSVDYEGNDFKALVYAFMVNGSLEEWLHPHVAEDGTHGRDKYLNLMQRINIAIDVACGIAYLHHQIGAPIVHCDIKPSNVLLDDEMIAHIGDFGLAKFLTQSIQNDHQSSSAGLRGTIGYAPPEYGLGSEVSIQGDIYSYGILLLEMFTGKKPTNDMFKEDWNLCEFVKSYLPNEVNAIIDPILLQEGSESDDSIKTESLISILEIGISCSAESPTDRMDVNDAIVKLQFIRDKSK